MNIPNLDDESRLLSAVALAYDGVSAPELTAKGTGNQASEIIEIARMHDVPIYENEALVDLLSNLSLGDSIPQELYIIIAEIIALAYKIRIELELNDNS